MKPLSQGEKKIEKYIYSMSNMLGKGSYATVFLGRNISDDSPTAVKVIDKKIFANQYNLKNIQLEIDIMKKIQHQNIVKLLDVYQTTNNMYIVTELCQEGDLRGFLKKKKRLAESEALSLLKDIVKGFEYLNQKEIIHRDLKPANILLSGGRCKISDFGFAKNLENGDSTIMQSIVGTPLYMSPQILHRQPYTNKSDLWSVGLIYYELLHGYTPWPAQNELQLINNIMNKPVVFDSALSEKSKDFIRGCLKRKEEDRMSWEEAFNHSLLKEDSANMFLRLRREDKQNRTPRKITEIHKDRDQKTPYRSKSKSTSKITTTLNTMNRTPKIKHTTIRAFDMTPDRIDRTERKSPWKM